MKLPKDLLTQTYTKPNLFLCEVDKTRICQLETTDMSGVFRFNSYSELEFTVGRTYEDMISGEQKVNPHYNKIEALRLVYLEGFGYFEIQDPEIISNGIQEEKHVTAYSLEYSLSQKYLENFLINTGEIGSVEVTYADDHETAITPVRLYYPQIPDLSLLHLVLEKIYGWKIGHVDSSLMQTTRTFDVSRASVYDFLTQDVCENFNCYIVFDSIENTINVYSESPITRFKGDGETTSFIVTAKYDNLSSVSINGYKTTAYIYNPDTGELIFENPPSASAMSNIEVVDGSQEQWVTDVYITFENLANEVNISYSADDIKTVLTVKGAENLGIEEVNFGLPYITDLSYYYSTEWMGQELYDAYTSYLEKCDKVQKNYTSNAQEMLVINNKVWYETNRLSLQYSIATVSSDTVGTYYVRGGESPHYYYTQVDLPSEYNADSIYYTLSGNDLNEKKFENFYDALKVYYNTNSTDDIKALEEDFVFMEEYSILDLINDLSSASTTIAKDTAVTKFLNLLWNQIGLVPLIKLYYEPYKIIRDTNVEAGWNETNNENYWSYYPVTVVISSLEAEQKERQSTIDELNSKYEELEKSNAQIISDLLITNNFTPKQLVRLSAFLREDEYTDDNFVETDSDTIDSLMQTKQELLECGRIELSKLCEPKLAFSMDMANIYALEEFEPIVSQFQLGNLINVAIRNDYIKRARLLEVNINFDDFSDFSCEFGELTNLKTPSSIHADLLSTALSAGKSVASNASYWNKGASLATSTDLKIQQGLLSATDGLYSFDQSITINENGILLRKVNDNGTFSPNQAWLTSNTILLSNDAFETSHTGLGEFEIDGENFYGILAQAMLSGYIESSTIVGGTINIGNGTFVVASDGTVTMKASSIEGYAGTGNIISSINQSPETITINANRISLAGKTIDLTSDNITINSTNFSVTKDGKITASSGEIAGWTIYPGLFRKDTTVDGVDYQIYMQSTDGSSTSNAFVVRKRNTGDTGDWTYQFKVNYAGTLTARDANISGTITATGGSIAGYNIGSGGCYSNALYKRVSGDVSDYEVGLKATSGDTDLAFYVKESTDNWSTNDETFFVRNNGYLYAQKADITGKITASSGKIGSWNVGDMGNYTDSIYTTYCAASTPSSSNPEYAIFMRGKGAENTLAFGVKKRTSSSTSWNDAENPFYVRKDGYVKMENAHVTGTINAKDGTIGGFEILSKVLRSDITKSGTRYQTFMQAADGTDTTTAFAVRTSDDNGSTWTYQFRVNYDGSATLRNATITGSSTIASACIPNLNASKITAGTLDVDRIPNISAGKITSGTISTDRLDASVITTGNFSSKTLSTSNLTVASGCRLGVASEYNALIRTVGDYTYIRGYGPDTNYETSFYNLVKYVVQNSSNKDIKNEIHGFDDRYDIFFDNLNPQLFKYNFEPNMGYTMGYIWQEVEEARITSNLSKNDLGALYETEGVTGGLALSKQDFIALNTWQIQKLKTRVEELENKLAALAS